MKELWRRCENRITPLSRISAGVMPTRKLSGQAVSWAKMFASYELRGGISGWTIDAFETAKAAHVTTTSSDDIANPVIDMDAQNIDNPDDIDGVYQKFSGQKTYVTSLSKEEQMEKENREVL